MIAIPSAKDRVAGDLTSSNSAAFMYVRKATMGQELPPMKNRGLCVWANGYRRLTQRKAKPNRAELVYR
jgi:hypothetical protein